MRQRETLRYDQTVFRDREVFEFTYMPDELHHRDAQIRELALLARPALRPVLPPVHGRSAGRPSNPLRTIAPGRSRFMINLFSSASTIPGSGGRL